MESKLATTHLLATFFSKEGAILLTEGFRLKSTWGLTLPKDPIKE